LAKTFLVYIVIQWIKGTFPRVRIDQMMQFAWKVLVPLALALITAQMIIMKLPLPIWINYALLLAANIAVVVAVLNILGSYFEREQVRSKRAFAPRSLIGTMQPVQSSSGD
jgi:NADH-quinone oxidoreductase subunit H